MARLQGRSNQPATWLTWLVGALVVGALGGAGIWLMSVVGRFVN